MVTTSAMWLTPGQAAPGRLASVTRLGDTAEVVTDGVPWTDVVSVALSAVALLATVIGLVLAARRRRAGDEAARRRQRVEIVAEVTAAGDWLRAEWDTVLAHANTANAMADTFPGVEADVPLKAALTKLDAVAPELQPVARDYQIATSALVRLLADASLATVEGRPRGDTIQLDGARAEYVRATEALRAAARREGSS
jgi:hypothetical protein